MLQTSPLDMPLLRRAAIIVVILGIGISTAPAVVAAGDVGPDNLRDSEWAEVFNSSTDSHYSGGDSKEITAFNKIYIDETSDKIRFALDMDNSTAPFNKNKNALQVYIDADGETGIDSSAGSGEWADFYDGLGGMNAEYRISNGSGFSAKIQEHDQGIFFNNIGEVEYEDDDSTNQYRYAIDKDAIGNPDSFGVKFAYTEKPSATKPGEFSWAPSNSVRVSDGSTAKTATVAVTAEFGRSDFDDQAAAEFTLSDDGQAVVTQSIENIDDAVNSGDLTEKFSVNPDDFSGSVNASVTITGDSNYTFERDVDNTVEVVNNGGLSESQSYQRSIHISVIKAEVGFDGKDTDGASVEFTLTDENGKTSVITETATDPVIKTFTVRPDNFNGTNSELTVDVTGNSNLPYNETRSVSVSESNEKKFIDGSKFEADKIKHKITIDPDSSSRDIGSDSGFTVSVDVESKSTNGGEGIYSVKHIINFDSDNLKDDLDNITVNKRSPSNPAILQETDVNSGELTIVMVSQDSFGGGKPIVASGTEKNLYDITFNFADGIQPELEQGSNVLQFNPTTVDQTKLYGDNKNDELSYITSSTGPVKVDNSEIRVTSVDITQQSVYGNMVNDPSRFEVSIDTNQGSLGDIKLNGSSGTSAVTKDCEGASSCTKSFKYKPTANTSFGNSYLDNYRFKLTIEDDSNNVLEKINNTDISQDDRFTGDLDAKVYKDGDFNGDGTVTGTVVNVSDVRSVIKKLGEGDGGSWGEAEGNLARRDVNNDGEISIADITTLVDELP